MKRSNGLSALYTTLFWFGVTVIVAYAALVTYAVAHVNGLW